VEMNELPIFHLIELIKSNPAVAVPPLLLVVGLVVLYYIAMVRSVIAMLRLEANNVLVPMTNPQVILSKATSEVAASSCSHELEERSGQHPPRVRRPTVSQRVDGRWSDLRTRWGFFDSLADSFAQNDRFLVGLSF